MNEKIVKPTEDLAGVTQAQLPAVIDDKIKPIYLKDIYTGKPGFVLVLSVRFNELVKEKSVSPDFSAFEDLGYKVERKHWHPEDRKFELGNAYDNFEGMVKVITLHPENLDPIEDVLLKGAQSTLFKILTEIEADMEQQLETEITRLQKLKGRSPK